MGYALAGALLTFLTLLPLAIMAVVFGVVAAVSLGILVWYLKGLKEL